MPVFREIAVDPASVDSWRTLQLLDVAFGFNRGRLIAKLPVKGPTKDEKYKEWRWHVLESIRVKDPKKLKRAEIFLAANGFRKKLFSKNRPYNFEVDWKTNARATHKSAAFDAIICDDPETTPPEYDLDDLDSASETCPEFWKDHQTFPICKRAQVMAESFAPLFRACNSILFVDPFFDPKEKKYQRSIQAFANAAVTGSGHHRVFEIHFSTKHINDGRSVNDLLAQCEKELEYCVPESISIRCCLWNEFIGGQRFHARYILTELAGLTSEHGIDEIANDEEFDFALMAEDHRIKVVGRFLNNGDDTFDPLGETVVSGKRKT